MSTVWPKCRSGAVGSKPALMRRGRPVLAALFEALAQVARADDLRCALLEQVHLFVYGQKFWHVSSSINFAGLR